MSEPAGDELALLLPPWLSDPAQAHPAVCPARLALTHPVAPQAAGRHTPGQLGSHVHFVTDLQDPEKALGFLSIDKEPYSEADYLRETQLVTSGGRIPDGREAPYKKTSKSGQFRPGGADCPPTAARLT